MFKGMTLFKCTQCGKHFKAPDIEYCATTFSMPQPCPKCGSIRTRPVSLFGKVTEEVYRGIWERMEKEQS
jgi:NAD-dependent SIR2 family protein deacetylase